MASTRVDFQTWLLDEYGYSLEEFHDLTMRERQKIYDDYENVTRYGVGKAKGGLPGWII